MIERWNTTKHLPLIHEWSRIRRLGPNAGDVSLIPPTGFVADDIVAGFLYVTNSKLGFIDSFVSDPTSAKEARRVAIIEIMGAIVADAREMGLHALTGAISVASLAATVKSCGFTVLPNCSYVYGKV